MCVERHWLLSFIAVVGRYHQPIVVVVVVVFNEPINDHHFDWRREQFGLMFAASTRDGIDSLISFSCWLREYSGSEFEWQYNMIRMEVFYGNRWFKSERFCCCCCCWLIDFIFDRAKDDLYQQHLVFLSNSRGEQYVVGVVVSRLISLIKLAITITIYGSENDPGHFTLILFFCKMSLDR